MPVILPSAGVSVKTNRPAGQIRARVHYVKFRLFADTGNLWYNPVPVNDDESFMREALAEARRAFTDGDIPVGAVAVHAGRIIARGHNRREVARDPTAHAELIAISRAAEALGGWRLLGVTLYCTLEPCAMCAGAMVLARLPELVYALPDPKAGAAGSVLNLLVGAPLNHRVATRTGVLQDEAAALMQEFFIALREGRVPRWSRRSRQAGRETD